MTEVSAARQLLDELFDAQQSGKNQTVQDTRDKLNALREKMGDEAFKDVLKKMIEEADEKFRAFLRQLLMQWFPDDGDAPSPAPPVQPGGGGGGGRGPSVPQSGFGPSESMSNKPITEGAKHFNYTPDNSNPGKKPDNIWSGFRQGPDGRIGLDYDPDIAVPIRAAGAKALVPDLWPMFRRLARKRPTLLVRGGTSDLLSADIAARMRRAAPAMAYVEVPGVGHAPMLEEPEARAAIFAFLAEVD